MDFSDIFDLNPDSFGPIARPPQPHHGSSSPDPSSKIVLREKVFYALLPARGPRWLRLLIRIVNLGVGVLMVLGGVSQFFPSLGLKVVIVGVYSIIFGLATALLEFQIPPQVTRYASFMFSFLGRGVFYIFLGSIIAGEHWYHYVPGTIIGVVGIAYVALEFVPSIEPPANMREADVGWGAEQV